MSSHALARSTDDLGADAILASLLLYGRSLIELGIGRLIRSCVLVVTGALVEGMGILLLVPLLEIVFRTPAGHENWQRRIGAALLHGLGPSAALAAILVLFVLLVAIRGVIVWHRDLSVRALSLDLVERWRGRTMAALCGAEWLRLKALRRGRVEFAVNADISRLALGSDRLLRGAVAIIQLVILAGVAVALSPIMALYLAGLLALLLPLGWRFARRAYGYGADLTRQGGARHDTFIEFMAGMKLAKALNAEAQYADAFMTISTGLRDRSIAYVGGQARAMAGYQVAVTGVAALLLWVGLVSGGVTPQTTSALLVVFARLSAPLVQMVQGSQSLLIMLPALDELAALERSLATTEAPGTPLADLAEASTSTSAASIALQNVWFAYPDQHRAVLQALDLALAAGEFVALTGPSGSGKTTLADILIGLMPPNRGSITLDGKPLGSDARSRAAWRCQIGYVPQDPFLFDRTIADNLRWASPATSEGKLWQVLEAVRAADFVRALPEGLNTYVGDRGSRLSGGERQRICLARALLRQPRLLVLDEATSALDGPTEQDLLETLAALRERPTILLITHRLPKMAPVDRCFEIGDRCP